MTTRLIGITLGVLLLSIGCAGSEDAADAGADSAVPTAAGSTLDVEPDPTAEPATAVPQTRSTPAEQLMLREHGELMIAISDNSATDHLLARLGRENVEMAMTRIGIANPAANIPLLSTADLFQLKFVAAEPNAAQYRELDPQARAAVLDELLAASVPWVSNPENLDLVNAEGVAIDQPRDLDIEWFASPDDMCRTMTHLADLARTPGLEPVAEILELNAGTGISFDRDRWPTIRFKGGSEPGVISGTWWFARDDGKQFVITAMASDTVNPIDEAAAITVFISALSLIS